MADIEKKMRSLISITNHILTHSGERKNCVTFSRVLSDESQLDLFTLLTILIKCKILRDEKHHAPSTIKKINKICNYCILLLQAQKNWLDEKCHAQFEICLSTVLRDIEICDSENGSIENFLKSRCDLAQIIAENAKPAPQITKSDQ